MSDNLQIRFYFINEKFEIFFSQIDCHFKVDNWNGRFSVQNQMLYSEIIEHFMLCILEFAFAAFTEQL